MPSSLPRLLATQAVGISRLIVSLAWISALLASLSAGAAAQTLVAAGDRPPEVEVNLDVLDELGPPPTLPDLLHDKSRRKTALAAPNRDRADKTVLRPPKKKHATASAAVKGKKHQQPTLAHSAAPIKPVAAKPGAVPRESVSATPLAEPTPASADAGTPPPAAPTAPAALAAASAPAAEASVSSPPPATEAAAVPEKPASTPTAPEKLAAAPAPPEKPATAPVAPAKPPAATPSAAVSTATPSPEAVTAMNSPPAVTPPAPVKPSPEITPVAAPAAIAEPLGRLTRIAFAGGSADLPDSAKATLDALAQRLIGGEQARLQLVAYAAGSGDQANQARRLSLSRALTVRTYLLEHGVPTARMDVRALGNRSESGEPPDRVDIVMMDR